MEHKKIELVPAVCTQCGAKLEVDPSQEAAVCKYCNTPFIVAKAINNYNVQNATIEHADNVNIDLTGSVKTTLDFFGEQLKESREAKKERAIIEAKNQAAFFTNFFKFFGIIVLITLVVWVIMQIFVWN